MQPPPPSSGAADAPIGAGSARAVLGLVLALTAIRLLAGGALGLTHDEAYYWSWSRHLAAGYLDHPPMVALLIRASTLLGGDGPFGIRLLAVLLGAAASLGVHRLILDVGGGARAALTGAALVQATLFLTPGALIVTPDTPQVAFWLIALLCAARVAATGDGRWWLAVGLAVGLAFQSKYSSVFLGLGLVLWVAMVPSMRRWLVSPWPYAGAIVSLVVIAPLVHWNLVHEGASFAKQFGRAIPRAFDPRFVPEFIGGQVALLTPLIAAIVAFGLVATARRALFDRDVGANLLIATTAPLLVYLLWYGLFDRVQGNWTACLLPASIAMAAMAGSSLHFKGFWRVLHDVARRWSVVCGVAIGLVALAHAAFRILPLAVDPTNQIAGWAEAARTIEARAAERGAGAVATLQYTVRAQLLYAGSRGTPVVQLNEPIRYAMEPPIDRKALSARPLLLVVEDRRLAAARRIVDGAYRSVTPAGTVERRWRGAVVDTLHLFVLSDPIDPMRDDLGPL